MFLVSVLKLVGNLPEKGLSWIHFIKVTGLLSRIYIVHNSHPKYFSGDIRKTAALKVSENSQKNIFIRAPF